MPTDGAVGLTDCITVNKEVVCVFEGGGAGMCMWARFFCLSFVPCLPCPFALVFHCRSLLFLHGASCTFVFRSVVPCFWLCAP